MALSAKVGSLTQPAATGNQSITGLGFTPKVIKFSWAGNQTADGSAAGSNQGFGFAVSSTQRAYIWLADKDATATTSGSADLNTTGCICFRSEGGATPALLSFADFVSLDADGFTINWTTADATARVVSYMALGGTDITNASIGSFTQNGVAGNQSITTPGFQPDSMIVMSDNSTILGINSNASITIGLVTAASQKISHRKMRGGLTASPMQDTAQRTDFLYWLASTTATTQGEASFTSFDATGFTFNNIGTANNRVHVYLAIKGATVKSGVFNQATSTGNQSVTGFGSFQPVGVLFASTMQVSGTTTDTTGSRLMIGMASSSSARAVTLGVTNNTFNISASDNLDRTKCIKVMTEGGAAPTTVTAADYVSSNSGGFTINNTTVDATSREISYMAFCTAVTSAVNSRFLMFM